MLGPWPEIIYIRRTRKRLGLSQQQLAKIASVDQSVISKIESSEIADPSYRLVRDLFQALEYVEQKHGSFLPDQMPAAADLMNRNVISVRTSERAKDAWKKMKQNGFSQLPVVDDRNRILGGIRESDLLLGDGERKVSDVMGETFPTIGMSTRLSKLKSMLESEHALLVVEKGQLRGIITAFDLISNAYDKAPHSLK